MKKTIPLVIALFSSASTLPVHADQFEIEADYTNSKTDFSGSSLPDIDSDSISFEGTYYCNDVVTNKAPLSVATVLSRTSTISAFYEASRNGPSTQSLRPSGAAQAPQSPMPHLVR